MSDSFYSDLVTVLPDEVKNKYLQKIEHPDKITFVDLINILKDCEKYGIQINYNTLNQLLQRGNIQTFAALEALYDSIPVIEKMNLEERFTIFNKIACSQEKSLTSLYNLLLMYKVIVELKNKLTEATEANNEVEFNKNFQELIIYLNNTNYFNKVIFLKFLLFFQKLNRYVRRNISDKTEEDLETRINKITEQLKETSCQTDTSFIDTLYDSDNVLDIYNIVINNIENQNTIQDPNTIQGRLDDKNIEQYKSLFNYNTNTNTNKSSEKASFFVAFHGTIMLINEKDKPYKYLTIKTPRNMISNLYRWGERGEPTIMFQTMKYSWKQFLISKNGPITKETLDKLFDITLAGEKKDYNFNETQENIQTNINNSNIIRIKHYSVDSSDYNIFNSKYEIPTELINNLKEKILEQNRTPKPKKYIKENGVKILNPEYAPWFSTFLSWLSEPFDSAERIIQLNCLLLNNNIEFSVFNDSYLKYGDRGFDWIGLYLDNLNNPKQQLQSYLRDYHFPLDLFINPQIYIQDFVLERDIYALEDMNINIRIRERQVQFTLKKGDSFACNPYIIEYFIEHFESIITIRPGYIINNIQNDILQENNNISVNGDDFGRTLTCPSKGVSCYKVTLASLTNYEILKFCSDAGIQSCDIYDTSCQSFGYITRFGGSYIEKDDPNEKTKAQRMLTKSETTVLNSEYTPRINKLLFDFEDKINERRYSHILLEFENAPTNDSTNAPTNAPLIEVHKDSQELPANTPVLPVSCIEQPEQEPLQNPDLPTPSVCSNIISCNDPMSSSCNNSKSILCNSTSKTQCNTIFEKLISLCNNNYSNFEILKKLLIPRYNIKTSRESLQPAKRKNLEYLGTDEQPIKKKSPEYIEYIKPKNKYQQDSEPETEIDEPKSVTKKIKIGGKKNTKTRKHKKYSNAKTRKHKKYKTKTRRRKNKTKSL